NKYDAGTAAKTDVAQAETQLEQTRAQAINVGVGRAQFEHAIAVLIGKPPAEVTITPVKFSMTPPPVPVGVPSELLERRPDIASAERTMASANAQASGADLAAARLSAQGSLATNYFELRVADELKALLDAEVAAFEHSLTITQNKYDAGTAAKTDVAQAETQLEQTRAQAINVGVGRAQFEHAIAVLIGKPPAELTIAPVRFSMTPPPVPVGVPSELLERRPDIATAERTMASANAQIGVAISSFYPTINLTGSYGFTGLALDGLFAASNAVWAVGPELALTVFDAGNRQAQVEQARATYDQDVALYRQTVLTAFQQVEDQLAALRILEQEAAVQDRAVAAALEAERLTLNQYEAGTVDYTTVVTAQTTSLNNQQTALSVMQSRILANVSLVEALGGGWTTAQMPSGG
ncbi:MAG TPA: efflux transporter outer membrane subunit, partial [Dongiaceae bacterium]|nr:efflux transporter outer membrane subunit [Dongiaceae bacterium]